VKDSRISLAFKALRELGPRKLGLFGFYKLGLKTGYFRWRTPNRQTRAVASGPSLALSRPLFQLPDPAELQAVIGPDGLSALKAEADEIVAGRLRLFGGPPVPLNLAPSGALSRWTDDARGKSPFPNDSTTPFPDIKFIWEPARFGWAFTLGRAYHLTGYERYPEAFWHQFETFQQQNPINLGPNWESAQEVALRLIAFAFAAQVFKGSLHSSASRKSQIVSAIAGHAARIPPSLVYARSQNNNHLLSEAAGLFTASLVLTDHPDASHWSRLGWKWFKRGLQTQIDEDGTYMQHSTNYHRLMLQLALWVLQVSGAADQAGPMQVPDDWSVNLANATRWLLSLTDPESGRVPNLGPNDGANILSLTVQPFEDYRPVLQAAARAFLGEDAFEPGVWDGMSLWLAANRQPPPAVHRSLSYPVQPTLHTTHSWAYLRAAHFRDRPGHADQLHLDLWWRGLNIAQDAGTYLYNAAPPWDNALTHTSVHNTVMVDNHQQMTPAGRFLYLDRAQAEVVAHENADDGSWERITAIHDGYQRLNLTHQRSVTAYQDGHWVIEDRLLPAPRGPFADQHTARLHWLLPDWDYELDSVGRKIQVKSPYGWIELSVNCQSPTVSSQLVRAGELLHGGGEISPTWGWVSPTYSQKTPALSFGVTAVGELPLTLISEWRFPGE